MQIKHLQTEKIQRDAEVRRINDDVQA